jgi:ASC-1-like (ASCH) protein
MKKQSASRNKRKKNKKKKKLKEFDKMTFEKREKLRARLKKERVYTKAFKTPQSFGAASAVRHISVEEYLEQQGTTNG